MYSKDYRKRAVAYKDEGHTFAELEKAFKISNGTYYRWKKESENGYERAKSPQVRTGGKIDREVLRQAVEERPDAYLRELADIFGCSPTAVHKMLKKMNITLKKRRSPTARNQKSKESSILRN